MSSSPTTRTATSPDGLALHVREFGDPTAATVVLVHGYPDTGMVWTGVADHLADRFHVVVPDVRGAGESEAPPTADGYALEHLAADIRTIADATSPDAPIHLVGHDWGSIQSWEAVAGGALDGRLSSFTTLSGPSLDHLGHWMRRGRLRDRLRQLPKSWYVAAFHTRLGPLPWQRGLADRWPVMLQRIEGIEPSTGHHAPTLERDGVTGIELYRANVRSRLREPQDRTTDVPVQLVVAEADRFVSPAMAAAAVPHCTTLVRRSVPDGHWGLLLRRPEAFAQLIAGFIDEVDAGAVPTGQSGDFAGKLVVVTGAGSGIGRETAEQFAVESAEVVCADISAEAADATASRIRAAGGTAHAVVVDVGDESAMEAFASAVLADHGVPDVVVNNAGIGMSGPFLDTSVDDWRRILDVNLWGVIHGCRLFGAAMVGRGLGGHIVNTSSASAFTPSKILPAYATTKSAVLMLSECLRAELASESIGVSAICPGLVATNITSTTKFVGSDAEAETEKQRSATALYERRNFTPDKVAAAILDAVRDNRAVVPVAPEAHALRALGRFAPRLARRFARLDPS